MDALDKATQTAVLTRLEAFVQTEEKPSTGKNAERSSQTDAEVRKGKGNAKKKIRSLIDIPRIKSSSGNCEWSETRWIS